MAGTPRAPGPAISLARCEERRRRSWARTRAPGSRLGKYGVSGQRAAVYLVLDYSGSMRPYYGDGSVQALADRVLGLSAHLDDDGPVPVASSPRTSTRSPRSPWTATRADRRIVAGLGHMGRTSYHLAMDAVIDHYLDSGRPPPPSSSSRRTAGRSTSSRRNGTCARPPGCRCSGSSSASATGGARSSTSCAGSTNWPYRQARPRQRRLLPRRFRSPDRPGRRAVRPAGRRFPHWLAAARARGSCGDPARTEGGRAHGRALAPTAGE